MIQTLQTDIKISFLAKTGCEFNLGELYCKKSGVFVFNPSMRWTIGSKSVTSGSSFMSTTRLHGTQLQLSHLFGSRF